MSGSRGYSFRIGAEGFQEFVQDLQRLAGSSVEANRAIETLIRSSPQLASSLTAASDATDRAAKRAVELRQAQEASAAASQSTITRHQAAGAALGGLETRALAASRATNDLRGGLELLGASGLAGALGPVAGSLGNLADLMGTAQLAAGRFGGVLTTLGRLFPPLAVAVAGITVATTDWSAVNDRVGNGLRSLSGAAYDTERATQSYRSAVDMLSQSLETAAQRERRLAQETRNRVATEANAAIEGTRVALTAAERRVAQLQPIADQVAAARALDPDTQIGGAAGRRFADYQAAAADVARMRTQVQEVEARIRDLQDVPFYADNPTAPPRASTGSGGSGGGRTTSAAPGPLTVYEYSDVAGQTVFPAEVIQAAWDRNTAIAERAREQAAQAAQRADERALQQREQANQRSTDAIVNYGADAFADMLDRNGQGFGGLMQTLEGAARRTFARIAAEAIIRPIVDPIVAQFGLGNISGTLGGGSSGGASSSEGGLSSLSSLGSTASSASSLAGTGAGFSSLGTAGSYSGLGAVAGSFALGYGGGSAIGGYLAGDSKARQENAQIGAAIGTAIGAFFGPVGAIAGGWIGGGAGGLIGPGPKTNAYGFEVNANGTFSTSDFGTTGNGEGGAEIYAQTQQLLAAANAVIVAAGVSVQARDLVIGANNGVDQPGTLNETFSEFRFSSSTSSRLNTAVANRPFASVEELAETIQTAQQLITIIDGFGEPMGSYATALQQINTAMGEGVLVARRLGFGEAELSVERNKQIAALNEQRAAGIYEITDRVKADYFRSIGLGEEADLLLFDLQAKNDIRTFTDAMKDLGAEANVTAGFLALLTATQATQRQEIIDGTTATAAAVDTEQASRRAADVIGGLSGFARGLRTSTENSGNPLSRLSAADAQFSGDLAGALGGDFRALSRLQDSAGTFLSASREVNGTGRGFARDEGRVISALDQVGGIGSDQLTAQAQADITQDLKLTLAGELQSLRAEVVALRREVQQGNARPMGAA